MSNDLVSIGIVNWNCGNYLGNCLRSVFAQTYSNIEVFVVDNASTDDSAEDVAREFPRVRIIRNLENVGFAAAQNQAIRASEGAYYMPLNPDVELDADFVKEMVAALEEHADYGYVSGLVYFLSDDPQAQYKVYTSGHCFMRNCYAFSIALGRTHRPEEFTEGEVGGASGVCPLYRRSMLEDIRIDSEYFDGSFFMYEEDVDLDWRAHLAGWHCWFTPCAIARHVMQATGGIDRPEIRARMAVNRYLMIIKNGDCLTLLASLPTILKFEWGRTRALILDDPRAIRFCLRGLWGKLRLAYKKRKIIHSRRRRGPREIRNWIDKNRRDLFLRGFA